MTKNAFAVKVNGELRDWNRVLEADSELEVVTANSEEGHHLLLHSTAHLMAQAVKELFPDAKITIGPAIENRFYYDFDVDQSFSEEDLARIEKRMRELSDEDLYVERRVLSKEEAIKLFGDLGETYKLEMIDEFEDGEVISAYSQGKFIDLCRGPHLPSTGLIKHFQLLNTAGAYWRGDENNPMLQRIYGTAFPTGEELEGYLELLRKARERDHRKLGKELSLFMFHRYSPGSPFFLPKGTVIYNELVRFIRELYREYHYQEVISPEIYDVELWKTSGHWDLFRDYMYHVKLGKRDFGLKPMNCPAHTLFYSSELRSYRDLPIRLADFGRLHRSEKAGVISGLTRVRSFSQDDSHIFCTRKQVAREMDSLLEMFEKAFEPFGFEKTEVVLSTRPEKALGDKELWDEAETLLEKILTEHGIDYLVEPGEGAFYGPKIDFNVRDALQRYHQLSTFQLDLTLPERFELTYVDEDGRDKRPVMIHRALLGSLERFIGVYIEHCGGDFPLWLAPVQVVVLPVSDKSSDYAMGVKQKLFDAGLRVEIDSRPDKIGARIRQAELQKVNVMLIVGEAEAKGQTVSVRRRFLGDLGQKKTDTLIRQLVAEIEDKRRVKEST
ncbi:MAG: threonine--tRNA ligase [Candidatus Neomarinimicrobiota bacterium]